MALPTTLQRQYETIYILRSDAGRDVTEAVADRVVEAIKTAGSVTRIENWGRRKLAYNVGREKRGIYVYFQYAGIGDLVSEVERTLRLQESVLKFQTVKIGEVETVEAAEVKFEHIDQLDEAEEDETYAQTLGLEARASSRFEPSDDDNDDLDEMDEVSDEDGEDDV
jgi:small subunit ribosomal protein S6